MSEEKKGYVPVYKDEDNFFSPVLRKYYVLFFTTDRIIVARTLTRKPPGIGLFAATQKNYLLQDSATSRATFEKIHELSPEELLKADKENFVIPNKMIDDIILKKNWILFNLERSYGEIKIHISTGDEHKFRFNPEFNLPDISEEDKKEQKIILNEKFENYVEFIENSFSDRLENKL
ncbi:hypothetical protein [uncultured Methanobacterium sp.]|uniref:hypothetical protein n=1 Tax=uncultured Methanobacterium sp. TaxID=176306 RepID=UPI002AA8A6CA|nr:hypothetical protein [uncultured Methanobacterium sp.]